MADLLEKMKSLAGLAERRRSMPFSSPRAAQAWLRNLPGTSDYDAHHALVEGLERYNGDTRGDTLNRLKVLRTIEAAGLPMQARLLAQYFGSHAAGDSARQTLWRECHLFWDQLAVAYLPFLRLALRGVVPRQLLPERAEITLKSLRYFSLSLRWEYLRGRRPGESAWQRLHKIYRMAEMADAVSVQVEIEGRKTSCAREYLMTLLFELANPYAFRPEEIRSVLEILDSLKQLPLPDTSLRLDRHTHMVDLAGSGGPESVDERRMPGGRLRYLDLHGVVQELEKRAGQEGPQGALCRKLAKVIGRPGTSRRGPRRPGFGEVRAVFGAEEAVQALAAEPGALPDAEWITLRDESSKGVGFMLDAPPPLPLGGLFAMDRDDGHGSWQMLAVRWAAQEGNQWLLGAEVLSRFPKRVDIEWEEADGGIWLEKAIFLPLAGAGQGAISNLLMRAEAYSAGRILVLRQEDGTRYRMKLGAIAERHETWLRVEFDVLSRQAAG